MDKLQVFKYSSIILAFPFFIGCKMASGDSVELKDAERVGEVKSDESVNKVWFANGEPSFADRTYAPYIHTVLLYKTGLELNEPVVLLNGTETITLRFDDLDGYLKDYSYSITHCTKNWEESGLTETEYLQGFMVNPVKDYKISFNTFQKYVHYSAVFPNDDLKILKSGNYLIKVFATSDPEQIILTRRFMVYENSCEIKPVVKQPSDLNERYYKQEIDFSIIPNNLSTSNTFDVFIRQNSRWDNMKSGFSPVFYRDNEMVYDLDQPDIFNGGNEFRFFDIRAVNYTTERVIKNVKTDSIYEAFLSVDKPRSSFKYLTNQDINGKYLIQNQNSPEDEHHSEADYLWVNFTLQYDQPFTDGTLYLLGAMSDWDFKPEFLLQYNDSLKCYEKRVLLKQGYYNYEYVLLKDNQKAASEVEVEGDHFETNNSYSIFVYYRDITNNYDRLVGYKPFTSINR